MAKILLVNFDDRSGPRLAAFLRAERAEVGVASEREPFARMLKRKGAPIDLIILDASRQEKHLCKVLNEIAAYQVRNGPRPMVLCISRVYRGPRFELDLERKGARLLYV